MIPATQTGLRFNKARAGYFPELPQPDRFSITWKQKKSGRTAVAIRATYLEIKDLAHQRCAERVEAEIFHRGKKIGWVGPDNSKRLGWGYYIDQSKILA